MPLIGSSARLSGTPLKVIGAWIPTLISVALTPVRSPPPDGPGVVVALVPPVVARGLPVIGSTVVWPGRNRLAGGGVDDGFGVSGRPLLAAGQFAAGVSAAGAYRRRPTVDHHRADDGREQQPHGDGAESEHETGATGATRATNQPDQVVHWSPPD